MGTQQKPVLKIKTGGQSKISYILAYHGGPEVYEGEILFKSQ